jgi:hypothetical protein
MGASHSEVRMLDRYSSASNHSTGSLYPSVTAAGMSDKPAHNRNLDPYLGAALLIMYLDEWSTEIEFMLIPNGIIE